MAISTTNEELKHKLLSLSDKFSHSVKTRWRSNISVLLSVILLLMITINIINTINFFIPQQIKRNAIQSLSEKIHSDLTLYQKIPHWHLFGISSSNTIAVTHLSLKLTGIIMDEEGRHSIAIIDTADGNEKLYRVGDTIPGGALIMAISSQEVIIQYLGRMERLPLHPIPDNNAPSNNQAISPDNNNPDNNNTGYNPGTNYPRVPGIQNYLNMLKELRNINQ